MATIDDIRAEHEAALASLTPQQLRAIERREQAKRLTAFRGGAPADHLLIIFAAEAACQAVIA